jgi:transcriptional regulator with XRE-family HTH domain
MGAGTELRQARERAGLSAEQIAERTKIQLHRIEALENGHFENLPAGIYLDGIVRAYAHEVAVDPEPLIDRVRYERAETATSWQAGPADLDAFASERPVANDAQSPTIVVPASASFKNDEPSDLSDLNIGSDRAAAISHVEPTHSRPGPGRFVLPLLLLLAAAGLGAYFYLANDRFDRVTPRDASATAVPPRDRSAATRETEQVVTGTSGPQEREATAAAPTPEPRNNPISRRTVAAPTPPATKEAAVSAKDVSGSWTLATHVESSSYQRFQGLKLGYDVQLAQTGNRVTGTGMKVSENGDGISARVRTPISVAGTINGDRLTLTFNERGARRPTEGKFVLLLDDSATMRGRFSSNAAHSSGTVEAHRVAR